MAEQKMHGFRAKLDYWLKHSNTFNRLFVGTASLGLKVLGLFVKIDKDMIIFSGHTRKYNDSPRTIYEKLIQMPKYSQLKCVWALDDLSTEIPGNPIRVKADTFKYFLYTLKAKYWVTCVNIERGLHYKKKGCVYLNTWHGVAFNCVGNAAGERQDYDFSAIDLFCYESEYQKEIFKRDMKVREGALIPTGLPRNDTLYNVTEHEIRSLKEKLGLPLEKKLILYAPTWRDSDDNGATYSIKPPIDVEKWKNSLKDDYILLLRTHAYTNKLLGIEFNDFVRDFTTYPVINDLFKISDILISDYSACIADYSILERPVICFAYDYDTYKAKRGLYIDFAQEMPSGIQGTEEDVLKHIQEMDYAVESAKTRDMIKNKFTYIGGKATDMCISQLFKQ